MSLAVLARKTRTKQKLKSSKRGFVLNMTGRGGGIGLSGMSYKQRGAVKSVKQRSNCKEAWTATFEFIPNETSGPNITTAQGLRLALGLYPLFGSGSEVKPLATIADSYTILSQRPHIINGVTLNIIFTLKMNFKKLYSVNITQAAFQTRATITLIKWEGSAPTGLVEWSLYSSINGYQRIGNSITFDAAVGFGSVPVAKSPDFRFERCNGSCTGKTGQSGTCCAADKIVEKSVRDACGQCWYGGMSQPAPQMSYRNYINRKASGAYRPGGRACCDPKCSNTDFGLEPPYINPNKNPNTWKKHPNISASEITEHKKLSAIRCANALVKRNQVKLGNVVISNRITAKPACSWYNPETCKYETAKKQTICKEGWTVTFEFHTTPPQNITTVQGLRLALGLYPVFASDFADVEKVFIAIADSYTILSQRPHTINGVKLIIFTLKMNFKKLYAVYRAQPTNRLIKWEGSVPTGLDSWFVISSINGYQLSSNIITFASEPFGGSSVPVSKSPDFRFEECNGCRSKSCALPIKGRLGYTSINNNRCNTTKTLTVSESSGDQIAKRKQAAFQCVCPNNSSSKSHKDCTVDENNKRSSNQYCFQRPMATGLVKKSCSVFHIYVKSDQSNADGRLLFKTVLGEGGFKINATISPSYYLKPGKDITVMNFTTGDDGSTFFFTQHFGGVTTYSIDSDPVWRTFNTVTIVEVETKQTVTISPLFESKAPQLGGQLIPLGIVASSGASEQWGSPQSSFSGTLKRFKAGNHYIVTFSGTRAGIFVIDN
jgi:hypothetical protein